MLRIYAADRLEPLAERLADVLSEAPADPMEPEWVATPGAGMRTWLWLELARRLGSSADGRDGVAANITPAFPGTLRSAILAADRTSDDPDPWGVEQLVWAILSELVLGAPAEPPGDQDPISERFGEESLGYRQARRIADLFDRYHVHRGDMIRSWAAGSATDPLGRKLPGHQAWQPVLWRRVRDRIGLPSPPEVLPGLLDRLATGDLPLDLPGRLVFFGLPVLPGGAGFIELASAAAEHRDLHLFIVDPAPRIGEATRARVRAGGAPDGPRRRSDDDTVDHVAHPLLRSWARLPRETAVLLADAEDRGFPAPEILGAAGSGRPTGTAPTLLERLRSDLVTGTEPSGGHQVDPADRSVQFHAVHGRGRQVEVTRDIILHALADDPTLTEDDILVVCPDLTTFAPLIAAGFGPSAGTAAPGDDGDDLHQGAPAIRYRIADRSVGHGNAMVEALAALLGLLPGRFDSVDLQDLLARPAVRARFRFTDDDLARIADWAADGEVRWGLDADHREPFGVPRTLTTNTWGAAVDRILLGSTLPDDDLALTVGDLAPIGIEGDDLDLAGRLADVLARLRVLVDAVAERRTVGNWLQLLDEAIDGLFASPERDDRETEVLRRGLADLAAAVDTAPGAADLLVDFSDVRRLVAERLTAIPGRPAFMRGGVTVTSLDSLRLVPHRVVVLLGMDQAAFAPASGDADDLTASPALLGDREPRADRRQAILDVLTSARDAVAVVREGHDLATNREVPPAIVVAELLDLVAATLAEPVDPHSLEIHHPRQPFHENCFVPSTLGAPRPWSFDPADRRAAEARRGRSRQVAPLLDRPLPPSVPGTVELDELAKAICDPNVDLLRNRLQVRIPDREEAPAVQLPVTFGGLERWDVGDRLFTAHRRGVSIDDWLAVEHRRGSIPPGSLGDQHVAGLRTAVEAMDEAIARFDIAPDDATPEQIDLTLPAGTRIVGSVADSFASGPRGPARLRFGRIKPQHELAAWLDLMALCATDPTAERRAVVLGWNPSGKGNLEERVLGYMIEDPEERRAAAIEALELAVGIMAVGRSQAIPLFPELSSAVNAAAADEKRAPGSKWNGYRVPADGDRPASKLLWEGFDIHGLYDLRSTADDPFDHPSRLEGWALHLWGAFERTTADGTLDDRSDASAPRASS